MRQVNSGVITIKIPYRYTDTELKKLLKSLTILIDSSEKKTDHIIQYLEDKGVKYRNRTLPYGDYSFILPANKEAGIMKDIYFTEQISIERKASLEEVSNCFAQDRQRFEAELIKSQGAGSKLILLVEVSRGYEKIVTGQYDTEYRKNSFLGTLFSFIYRYNLNVNFIDRRLAGQYIYLSFYYWLREFLK